MRYISPVFWNARLDAQAREVSTTLLTRKYWPGDADVLGPPSAPEHQGAQGGSGQAASSVPTPTGAASPSAAEATTAYYDSPAKQSAGGLKAQPIVPRANRTTTQW